MRGGRNAKAAGAGKGAGCIPVELRDFFGAGGRSLVVKGAPGTGKTTLAMELLAELAGDGKALFVSARVDEQALTRHLRWVRHDMLLSGGRDEGARLKSDGTLSRKELDRLESRIEEGDGALEEDAEPDMRSGKLEGDQWTIDVMALLPELDLLYERLGGGEPGGAMVAIDSVDSLSEKYGVAAKRLVHVIQKDLVERSGVSVIFILERAGEGNLDYMGDGVVSLDMDTVGGRRVRLMRLEKLRGQAIWCPELVFTLDGGRFCAAGGRADEQRAGTEENAASPLDGIGEPGTYSIIELEGNIGPEKVRELVKELAGRSARKTPAIYTTPSRRLFGNGLAGAEGLGIPMHFLGTRSMLNRRDDFPGITMVDGDSFASDFDPEFIGQLTGAGKAAFIADLDHILSHYGGTAARDLESHISRLVREGGSCVAFTWSEETARLADTGMADRLMRLACNGPHVLYIGVKPHTPAFMEARDSLGRTVLRPVI